MAKFKRRYIAYNPTVKGINPWDPDGHPEAWTWLTGDLADTPERDFYKLIPTLYRGAQLKGQAVGSMPFEVVTENDKPYDTSADWKNKCGFLPNPNITLQLIEMALALTGKCYFMREKNPAGYLKLRYLLPTSVTHVTDPETGQLIGFKRPVKNVLTDFKLEQILYFWLPDPWVELGPPINYPAAAAANACGVLLNLDYFASQFFKRGAIKAMVLTVEGPVLETEKQKLKMWFNNMISGIKNAFRAEVINADFVKPVILGEGMQELQNVTIGEEKRQDIAVALGIPMSILFANAANYATSQQDELNFLTKYIIPDCEFIQGVLNENVWQPMGLKMNFLPETLDAMQEDEEARSLALNNLVNAGFDLLTACDILGFELTNEQRQALLNKQIEKKQRAEVFAANLAGSNQPPKPAEEPVGPTEEEQYTEQVKAELAKWERKALKALKAGKPAAVDFESDVISDEIAKYIIEGLEKATTAAEVKVLFANPLPSRNTEGISPLMLIANELKRANDLLERT